MDISHRPMVLAAFDGHDRAPLRLGESVSGILDAELHVITTYDPALRGDDDSRRFTAAVGRQDRALRSSAAGAQTSVVPAGPHPDGTLLEVAGGLDACLIVVGFDQHGTVTRDVVAEARSPVLVATGAGRSIPASGGQIGVAFDGSASSRHALVAAACLARRTGAALTLVFCVEDARPAPDPASVPAVDLSGLDVHQVVGTGDPRELLRHHAARFDLLAAGCRGRGQLLSMVLGSVSKDLISAPPCPVLVVPSRVRPDPASPLGLSSSGAVATT